jgi:hypothetical protein
MIGRIEETSASFEARSAPRSYPTPINGHSSYSAAPDLAAAEIKSEQTRRYVVEVPPVLDGMISATAVPVANTR